MGALHGRHRTVRVSRNSHTLIADARLGLSLVFWSGDVGQVPYSQRRAAGHAGAQEPLVMVLCVASTESP